MLDAVATTGNGMTLPSLKTPLASPTNVYGSKNKDRHPHIRAAGIRACRASERVKDCMICPEKEISPEVIKKFHAFTMPDPGVQRIFYGKAFDPQRELAAKICHGMLSKDTTSCKELLHLPLKTNFQNKLGELKENIYASNKRAPLGKSCPQPLFAPKNLKSSLDIFGKPLVKSENLYEIVNPPLPYSEVMDASQKGHELYVQTHKDFLPGEQIKRSYTFPAFDPKLRFGESVSHWNDGRYMKETLNWTTLTQDKNAARIVPKLQDDFRERTQPQLSQPFDPIKDTLLVPFDHCFGWVPPNDGYGVRDLMHYDCPLQNIKDPLRQRGLLMSTRRFLRHCQYQQFEDLIRSLTQCDREACGRLPVSTVMDLCLEYKLPVDFCVLGSLLQNCNPGDGMIYYKNFVDFINWTKPLPSFDEFPVKEASLMNEVNNPDLNINPEAKVELCCHSEKPMAPNPDTFKTTNRDINAFVGKVSTKDWRKSGIPSIRYDLTPPQIKPVADRINYGDEGTSHDLVCPTVFACNGVSSKDMTTPRSFNEIKEIFMNIGFNYDHEALETFYNQLAQQDSKGEVSIESFRHFLNCLPVEQPECLP